MQKMYFKWFNFCLSLNVVYIVKMHVVEKTYLQRSRICVTHRPHHMVEFAYIRRLFVKTSIQLCAFAKLTFRPIFVLDVFRRFVRTGIFHTANELFFKIFSRG